MASMASMKSMRPGAAAPPSLPSAISQKVVREEGGEVDGQDETGKELNMSQFKSFKSKTAADFLPTKESTFSEIYNGEDGKSTAAEYQEGEAEGEEDKEEEKLVGEEGNLSPSGSRRMSQNNLPLHVIDGEVVSVPAIIKHKIQDKIGIDNNGLAYVMKVRNLFDDLDANDLGYLGWQQLRKVDRVASHFVFLFVRLGMTLLCSPLLPRKRGIE